MVPGMRRISRRRAGGRLRAPAGVRSAAHLLIRDRTSSTQSHLSGVRTREPGLLSRRSGTARPVRTTRPRAGHLPVELPVTPYGRTVTLLSDLFNIHLSEGSISNFTQRAASHLVDVEKAIYQALCHADTVHFDETGVRIAGKLNWLHVSSTPEQTFYAHHPKRGGSALDDIGILPQFGGRAIHDEWNAYHRYGCRHGLCNAHHLRELTAVEEQLSQPWAKDMRRS